MFKRQTTGSVVCASCGYLVGVKDDRCYHCGRRNPGLWGFAPALRSLGQDLGFVPIVTGISHRGVRRQSGDVGREHRDVGVRLSRARQLRAVEPSARSGAAPVFALNRWWTLLSAAWLHGSLLHIVLNMYWVRQLGPAVAEFYGPGRMVIIYIAGGIVGFAASSAAGMFLWFMPPMLRGGILTVGASASIFGLLGALVYYGRRGGSSVVYTQAMSYAVMMFVFGLMLPGIDNYAHAGGFLGGWLAGRLLDPLHPERINHMLIAVVVAGTVAPVDPDLTAAAGGASALLMRKPSVLITGAGGEIGHGLIDRLAADGSRSIVTLDLAPLDPELAKKVQREVTGSILDHAAARAGPVGVRGRSRLSSRRAALDPFRVLAGDGARGQRRRAR